MCQQKYDNPQIFIRDGGIIIFRGRFESSINPQSALKIRIEGMYFDLGCWQNSIFKMSTQGFN